MLMPRLAFSKLGTAGAEQVKALATLAFPGALPSPPLGVNTAGMRIQIVDLGAASAVLLDHFIPGGPRGTHCDPRDGWRANAALTSESYGSRSDAIPPACVAGSGLGVFKAKAVDDTADADGVRAQVKGKKSTYGPAVGPFRLTIVLGGWAESTAAQCAEHTFAIGDCDTNTSGTRIKCLTP
jgi:hypothetical protein